jgi:PKD repeat protein
LNEPPTPDTGGPYTGYVNASIAFDASNSSDPDGDDIGSYEWDFGDGTNGNGVSVEHTYSSIGNYTVTLTVTDSQDKTSTISTYANIVVQTTVQPPDQNDNNGDDTPGFEIFMAIIAISFILFWKRRK